MKKTLVSLVMLALLSGGVVEAKKKKRALIELGDGDGKPKIEYKNIELPDGSRAMMSNRVLNTLGSVYHGLPYELPLCVMGRKGPNIVYIDRLMFPLYGDLREFEAHVYSGECKEEGDYLGIVHNHTASENCMPSQVDADRFVGDKDAKLEIVVCGANRITGDLRYSIYVKRAPKSNLNADNGGVNNVRSINQNE